MSLSDQLYAASPVIVQHAAASVYGFRLRRRRYGTTFRATVAELKRREFWSPEQFGEFQLSSLRSMCEQAYGSQFYRERFDAVGFKPSDLVGLQDLAVLPLTAKEDLRASARQMVTGKPGSDVVAYKSSGTTGTPCEIFRSKRTDQLIWAFWEARCWNWFDVSYRAKKAVLGVKKVHPVSRRDPPFWRHDWLTGTCYFSIYHLARENLEDYCRELRRFAPEMILAYPSAIAPIAQFALESGAELPRPRGIVTTSETLSTYQREQIEAAFRCRIYDQYGAAEACVFGATCQEGRLHLSPDYAYTEIIRNDGLPAGPGEVGEVVCTGFLNPVQPLIRYRIGDMVRLSATQTCPCGRAMPILDEIMGRVEDTLYTIRGDPVIRFDTVFKGVEGVREGQVVQRSPSGFVIRLVPDQRFSNDEALVLVHNMEKHLGPGHHVSIETVSSIERTSSGKFKAVVNEARETG